MKSNELEERKIKLLAELFKAYKSPEGLKLEFDDKDGIILRDLIARGFVDPGAKGFESAFGEPDCFESGGIESPITPEGVKYLEQTNIEKFIDRPVYKLLKEIRQWL